MEKRYNPNYKPLLKLIFENCNKNKKCKYKVYQSDQNIDEICDALSHISQFVERTIKVVKSPLNFKDKITQIQRFKDENHQPIFDDDRSDQLLKLMTLFINPDAINKKKAHLHACHHNPVYNKCHSMLYNAPITNIHDTPALTSTDRDIYINAFYDQLNIDELQRLEEMANDRMNASKYKSMVKSVEVQHGGSANPDDPLINKTDVIDQNSAFFRELFHRISGKIQEDRTYGTLGTIVDYKKRLEKFVRESVQDMDVPENLRYFVDNISNLVDAIYPSNILDFVKNDDSIASKVANEFAEPFELVELVLFALSVIPLPVVNLIPDFMLIVHNILNGKRIMFTILSSIALIIKIMTLLFFDFGPLLKMFYLSKKIKNFNITDITQVLDKTANDVLMMPGTITDLGAGMISKAILPLASAGQLRPENLSLQIGNMTPVTGASPNPMATLASMASKLQMPVGSGSGSSSSGSGINLQNIAQGITTLQTNSSKKRYEEVQQQLLKAKERYNKEKDNYDREMDNPSIDHNLKIQRIQNNLKAAEQQKASLESELATLSGRIEAAGGITETEIDINSKVRELENLDRNILIRECKLNDPKQTKKVCEGLPKRMTLANDATANNRLNMELRQLQAKRSALWSSIPEDTRMTYTNKYKYPSTSSPSRTSTSTAIPTAVPAPTMTPPAPTMTPPAPTMTPPASTMTPPASRSSTPAPNRVVSRTVRADGVPMATFADGVTQPQYPTPIQYTGTPVPAKV